MMHEQVGTWTLPGFHSKISPTRRCCWSVLRVSRSGPGNLRGAVSSVFSNLLLTSDTAMVDASKNRRLKGARTSMGIGSLGSMVKTSFMVSVKALSSDPPGVVPHTKARFAIEVTPLFCSIVMVASVSPTALARATKTALDSIIEAAIVDHYNRVFTKGIFEQ